MTSSPYTFQF